jgi:hypothetical protein
MTVKGLEKWGDKVRECPLLNGNISYYVNYEGLDFEVGIYLKDEDKVEAYTQVDNCLMAVLSECYRQKRRVRVWYGDGKTGESWFEDFETTGYIGRSCGDFKVPLIVSNSRSWGGGALSVGSVIRVDDIKTRKTLWKVPNYYDKLELFHVKGNKLPWQVCGRSTTLACFETEEKARRWIDFQQGRRYNR